MADAWAIVPRSSWRLTACGCWPRSALLTRGLRPQLTAFGCNRRRRRRYGWWGLASSPRTL